MREILFRGKDKNDGTWFEGFFVKHGDSVYLLTKGQVGRGIGDGGWLNCCQMHSVIPETVGQYTGLHDKNGRQIFEGDVVRAQLTFGSAALEGCYAIGYIVYEADSFKICVTESHNAREHAQYTGENQSAYYIDQNFLQRRYRVEVIGNIHDNPELPKEE